MLRLNSFLAGLRVIDVSACLPGPFASLLLSDMDADVVKVELPQGDGMRLLGPCDGAVKPLFPVPVDGQPPATRRDMTARE
jgi:alpha-methylacyl-CoA racemase